MTTPELSSVLNTFFADPGHRFAELGQEIESFGFPLLDDHKGLEGLLPRPDLTPEQCFVWRTAFDNAPFLILARTEATTDEGRMGHYSFIQRRVWLMDLEESQGKAWIDDRAGKPADETSSQKDGATAHIWTIESQSPVLQDGYRLYVAAGDEALVLDRIAMVRA
ncbi:MAG: hypothetical protein AAF720_07195 [Pseudomonadota bacterium]